MTDDMNNKVSWIWNRLSSMSSLEKLFYVKRIFQIKYDNVLYSLKIQKLQNPTLRQILSSKFFNSYPDNFKFLKLSDQDIVLRVITFFQKGYFATLWNDEGLTNKQEFKDIFPKEWENTICAANNYVSHSFRIFGRTCHFRDSINWHFDILKGKAVPQKFWSKINYRDPQVVSEIKYLWELNRHQHFVTLGKAYYLTKQEKYAEELFAQWGHWIETNPPLHGLNWASPLELGLRIISWTWALHFTASSRSLSTVLFANILKTIYCQAEQIVKFHSRYSSANNHLLGEALGLLYAGIFYPFFKKAPKWRKLALKILQRELSKQIFPSGVNREQSTYYHWYVLDFYLLAIHALRYNGETPPETWIESATKMAYYLKQMVCCNGTLIPLGDEDGGQAILLSESHQRRFVSTLNLASVIFEQTDLAFASNESDELTFWMCGVDSRATSSKMKTHTSEQDVVVYEDAGVAIFSDTSDEIERKLVFRFGPLGYGPLAAHGHADALSVVLYVAGEPYLVDPGTFTYYSDPEWRNYFRSTKAHNTVVVDQADQSEMLGPFIWGKRANAKLEKVERASGRPIICASHDGYSRSGASIVHRRSVFYPQKNVWVVRDELYGKGEHVFQLCWQLPFGDVQTEKLKGLTGSTYRIFSNGPNKDFCLQVHSSEYGECTVQRGEMSPRFGEKRRMSTVVYENKSFAPVTFTTQIKLFGAELPKEKAIEFIGEK